MFPDVGSDPRSTRPTDAPLNDRMADHRLADTHSSGGPPTHSPERRGAEGPPYAAPHRGPFGGPHHHDPPMAPTSSRALFDTPQNPTLSNTSASPQNTGGAGGTSAGGVSVGVHATMLPSTGSGPIASGGGDHRHSQQTPHVQQPAWLSSLLSKKKAPSTSTTQHDAPAGVGSLLADRTTSVGVQQQQTTTPGDGDGEGKDEERGEGDGVTRDGMGGDGTGDAAEQQPRKKRVPFGASLAKLRAEVCVMFDCHTMAVPISYHVLIIIIIPHPHTGPQHPGPPTYHLSQPTTSTTAATAPLQG